MSEEATSPLEYMRRVIAETEAMMAQQLHAARTEDDVRGLARALLTQADAVAATLATLAPLKAPACRQGCDACCHNLIQVRPLFAILAVDYVRATFSAEQLRALSERLGSARAPHCPFLAEGLCSIYAARPMVCRGYYSFDAALCAQGKACEKDLGYQGEGAHALHQLMVFLLVLERRLEAVEADCGLESGPVFLDNAVRILLTDSTATTRWLAGEQVFSEA